MTGAAAGDVGWLLGPEGPLHRAATIGVAVCGVDLSNARQTTRLACDVYGIPLCQECWPPLPAPVYSQRARPGWPRRPAPDAMRTLGRYPRANQAGLFCGYTDQMRDDELEAALHFGKRLERTGAPVDVDALEAAWRADRRCTAAELLNLMRLGRRLVR